MVDDALMYVRIVGMACMAEICVYGGIMTGPADEWKCFPRLSHLVTKIKNDFPSIAIIAKWVFIFKTLLL